ncbi:molybdate transport system substrate-binding protein [Arboricoccus pini]|uniref:Molybdate transport system substrate-binding protein n=1 Tax=Arboricoccus pini TaxID=1963835 RepID=A0A212QUY5_9PROT|nr:substrate-binding domain-containing protein [Arboricoccus pini]SNB63384.1 molybdate transport system substrate-binding protein [Arboricoccus pini]
MPQALHVMSTLAVEVAFKRAILPSWSARQGPVNLDWAPTTVLLDNILKGARADVVILIDDPMARLAADGIVDQESITPIAQAKFGLAVKEGAPKPDISDAEKFVAAIKAARSVAYSLTGASGLYFAKLIEQLGIEEQVLPRATRIPKGFTAEKLLTGEADLAVQQVSELMAVDGVDIVGPFPEPLQQPTNFSVAIFKEASDRGLANAFLDHLTSKEAHEAYNTFGLASRIATFKI